MSEPVASGDLVPYADPALPVGYDDVTHALRAAYLLGYGNNRTREAYARDVDQYARWCHTQGLDMLDASRRHIDAWARDLENGVTGHAYARGSVARKLSAVAGWYEYAVDEGLVDRNPVARVRRPQVRNAPLGQYLARDEAAAYLDAAEQASPRDHALACLLLLNGLRVSSAVSLRIEDIHESEGRWILAVTVKGGGRQEHAMAPRTVHAVTTAIGRRRVGHVLLDTSGRPMNRQQAWRAVRRIARAALPRAKADHVTPHTLRRTAITLVLKAGAPLHVAQRLAGHADPRTTQRYDQARDELEGHGTYTLSAHIGGA